MKRNLLIIVNRMTGAGPARVASNLSLYLSNAKFNKFIVIYDAENATYKLDGKEIINLNTKPTNNPIKKLLNTIKRIRILRKIKKRYKIDVSLSLLPNPNMVNILSNVNDKVIVSERSFMSKELKGIHGKIYKFIFRNLYDKANKVIAVSKLVKEDLITNFGIPKDKIKVIYNFYDVEKIQLLSEESIPSEHQESYGAPTIITVGRLSYQKGHWHLIRAFKEVKEKIPNAKLLILGEGELMSYLEELTSNLELKEDIHFLGFQSNPFKYIAKANLFVFPSMYEGFPNALAEAMACGIPVISSDCPSGPREILSSSLDIKEPVIKDIRYDEYGVLVPTPDGVKYDANELLTKEEKMLSESIVTMLKDEQLLKKYKERSLNRITDFHIDEIIKQWEEKL